MLNQEKQIPRFTGNCRKMEITTVMYRGKLPSSGRLETGGFSTYHLTVTRSSMFDQSDMPIPIIPKFCPKLLTVPVH
jgi:hypothetical protein